MDDIKELVLKHEREISQLSAIQEIMVEQIKEMNATVSKISDAITKIEVAIEQQREELKTAINIKNELVEISKSLLVERQQQRDTNQRIFERIEKLEDSVEGLKEEVKKLSDSTTFARWLDGGFKVLSKRAAVVILFVLGLMILGAFLGIDLHNLIRKN